MFANASRQALGLAIFNATNWANVVDNAATSPLTNLQAALHTAWPGRTGNQSTSEATYTNYGRVAIPRTSAGFTVGSDGTITLTSARSFPASSATGNNQYCPFVSFGSASTGTGQIIQQGALIKSGTTGVPAFTGTNDTINAPAHGGSVNDRCCFLKLGNAPLPGGITEGTVYYIVSAADANSLTVSTSQGGAAVDITSAGAALLLILDGFLVANNYTPTLTTSSTIYVD